MTDDALRRRYLSLWLPFLPADRWRLENGADDKRPLVFVAKAKGASLLTVVDQQALSLGLKAGMALADARARLPELHAVATSPSADGAFLGRLADLALAFTPSVALDLPGGLVLDITGCAHLFAGEAGLAARLNVALQAAGVSVAKLFIAPTPDMARALARFARTNPCFAHDDELVRALPVAALECAEEDTVALKRAGLKTIADVASRPSLLFTARFTSTFTAKLARVLGEDDRRISPIRPLPNYTAEYHCVDPVVSHDAIARIVADLATIVRDKLRGRGEGGRVFESTFCRTDGVVRRIRVETSLPTRDPAVILRLYRDRFDALADPLDPGFGFDLIRFEAVRTEPCRETQTSLDAQDDKSSKITHLVDRLGAMLGRERIIRLQSIDSHIPERAQTVAPASDVTSPSEWTSRPLVNEMWRPPFLYDPPHPIEVDANSNDLPTRFRWRRLTHLVAEMVGPERIAEEWWLSPSGYGTRDYYRVESFDGRRFWIFRTASTTLAEPRKWFLHGLFP